MKVFDEEEVLSFIRLNLRYRPEGGFFEWLEDRAGGKVKAGTKAGSTTARGYSQVRIFGKWVKVHRLVWLVETGSWPDGQIDHIDRDTSNNKFSNLRVVSNYINCLNRSRKSSTGVTGVTLDKKSGRYLAQTYKGGKNRNLGRYNTIEEAKVAYDEANKTRKH